MSQKSLAQWLGNLLSATALALPYVASLVKECFRCGKKGHPKAECTVKMTPADYKSKSKSPKSNKSSSSSTSSKSDISKMFGEMNKTIKTFGKALSQVSEVVDNFSKNASIGAQSHAQVSRVGLGSCGYAFALQSLSLRDY